MPKVQIPKEDQNDSRKIVEHIQRAVQDQLSRKSGTGAPGTAGAVGGTAEGLYIKW